MASATFDFSHPSNFSVNHPVSPVTEGLSHRGRGAQNAGSRAVKSVDSAVRGRALCAGVRPRAVPRSPLGCALSAEAGLPLMPFVRAADAATLGFSMDSAAGLRG